MKVKKLLKISGIVILSLVVLAVAIWHVLPLLPMTPPGEMARALVVQMTKNEEQLAAQTEKSDTAYHHLRAVRHAFPFLATRLMGPKPGDYRIAPLLPDILRLSVAASRTDKLYTHYTRPADGWLTTAPAVEPEIQEELIRDTEAFFRQAAEAQDMQTQYAACAALALRWIPALPMDDEQESRMTQLTMAMAPAARPLLIRYLDTRDDTVYPMMQALPALRVLFREFLKQNPPQLQKLIAEIVQLDASTLETLRTVNDAATARTAAEKLRNINERRNQLYIFLAPVLFDEPKCPELQKLDEFQPGIEKRVEELHKLPEPFYGCKELADIFCWG